jgi:hypothetical protein
MTGARVLEKSGAPAAYQRATNDEELRCARLLQRSRRASKNGCRMAPVCEFVYKRVRAAC